MKGGVKEPFIYEVLLLAYMSRQLSYCKYYCEYSTPCAGLGKLENLVFSEKGTCLTGRCLK